MIGDILHCNAAHDAPDLRLVRQFGMEIYCCAWLRLHWCKSAAQNLCAAKVASVSASVPTQLLAIPMEEIRSIVRQYATAMTACILQAEQDPDSAAGRRLVR